LHVLVVDDFRDAAESMADVLALHGHRVAVAFTARKALEVVAADAIDVVLLDVEMPGMDGCEMVREVFARAARKRPFLIAVTACTSDGDRERCLAAGVDAYLTKPVEPAVIVGMLGRIRRFLHPAVAEANGKHV
jgi:CheY-like chemotaxis protein